MKKIAMILCLPVVLMAACQNNSNEETMTTTDSTTVMESATVPADTTGMASSADSTATSSSDMNGSNTGNTRSGSNMSARNSSNTSNSNTSNINNTSASRKPAPVDTRTTLEKTGHYNSDVQDPPKPLNLDDKQFKNRKPLHTYGDTSLRAVPGR